MNRVIIALHLDMRTVSMFISLEANILLNIYKVIIR